MAPARAISPSVRVMASAATEASAISVENVSIASSSARVRSATAPSTSKSLFVCSDVKTATSNTAPEIVMVESANFVRLASASADAGVTKSALY